MQCVDSKTRSGRDDVERVRKGLKPPAPSWLDRYQQKIRSTYAKCRYIKRKQDGGRQCDSGGVAVMWGLHCQWSLQHVDGMMGNGSDTRMYKFV